MPQWVGVTVFSAKVLALLKGMEERGEGGLLPVNRQFGEYQKGSIRRNFEAGGRPTPWPPLKLGTLSGWAVSRKSFVSKKTGALTKTGREALTGRKRLIDRGLLINRTFYVASPRGVTLFNDSPYAGIQHFGAKIPPIYPKNRKALAWPGLAYPVKHTRGGVIPPSPFMLFQDEDVDYYERLALEFILTRRLL